MCFDYLNNTIEDEQLREKMTPTYPIGAKRILTANGYYEALTQQNVELVTEEIKCIGQTGIETSDGLSRDFDVIIYGTGFVTNPFLDDIDIVGRGGKTLSNHWSQGAHAHLGVATHNFPNLFFLYGPNTNLGHNSILLMSEAQIKLIMQILLASEHSGWRSAEVRKDVEDAYNETLQQRLRSTVWNEVSESWYRIGDRITNNWPGSVGEYRRILRRFSPGDFLLDKTG